MAPNSSSAVPDNDRTPVTYRRVVEVIIVIASVFLLGYIMGQRRRSHRRAPAAPAPSPTARPSRPHRHGTTTEREHGGFGALGATNDPSDIGDFGP